MSQGSEALYKVEKLEKRVAALEKRVTALENESKEQRAERARAIEGYA